MTLNGSPDNLVIVATPTSSLLSHLLHALSHSDLEITLITRPTSISFSLKSHNHNHNGSQHNHEHTHETTKATLTHHQLRDLSSTTLTPHLSSTTTLLTLLVGSDLNLTPTLITIATSAKIKRFIPTEFGLDTSNAALRQLLSPYQVRWKLQESLRSTTLQWTALYAGCILEDAMKADDVLGIDIRWASVSAWSGREIGGEREIVLTTRADVANALVKLIQLPASAWESVNAKQVYISSYITNIEEIVQIVEGIDGRTYDWYEFVGDMARREADDRMKMGYFDGAIALRTRIVVWDEEGIGAWSGWKKSGVAGNELLGVQSRSLEEVLGGVVRDLKEGKDEGCGC